MISAAAKRSFCEAVRPTGRMRASEWAAQERHLKPGTTPQPGLWRNDYAPWLAPILDAFDDSPWCQGWVLMKPAQSQGSEVGITLLGYLFTYEPGPVLFVCSTGESAKAFSYDRFEYMIEHSPMLRTRFLHGRQEHETRLVKPAIGGTLAITGSNSPNPLISKPCRYVFMDEEDRLPDFPGVGAARSLAEKRVSEFQTRCRTGIFSWAHPTTPDRGVAATYYGQSDQREWTFDCPHCAEPIVPKWHHVHIIERRPETAEYRCPHCSQAITDAQRWAATKAGRFVSQLPEAQARQRRFVGFHMSRLCHPRAALFDLAQQYCACTSESQLRVFFNMVMGEPYQEAQYVLTSMAIEAKRDERLVERRAPEKTLFITAGVDPQKGADQVVLYYTVSAWTPNGNEVLLEYGRLLGWPALDSLLRTFEAPCGEKKLRIAACGIDYGWKTREVYSFCRQQHGGVPCVPLKHTPGVMPAEPSRRKDTKDPLHPEYGGLVRFEVCRDYWMDRCLGRFHAEADPEIGGSILLPATTSREFIAHIKSARRVEITDKHGHSRITWEKERYERDDWLQDLVYAEVVAVGLGLDRAHEAIPQRPPDSPDVAGGQVARAARYQGRPGYVRGRRGRAGPY
jgi:phage terminase large subunit GpA-like protein